MTFNDLLQKIYSENDIPTNISIFISSIVGVFVYLFIKDSYLSFAIAVGFFSITKVISLVLAGELLKKEEQKNRAAAYSKSEMDVINSFIFRGSCFLSLSDLRSGVIQIDQIGFDSLMARNVIIFLERGMGDGPSGFQLDEYLYRNFLK